jgi:hypothetical protein
MSLSESEVSNKHKQLKVIYMLAQKSKMGAYKPRKNISFWVGISVMFSSIVLAMYFSSLWFCLGIPLGRIFDLLMQRYSTFENDYDNAINSFFLEYIPANTYAFDEMKNNIQKCGHMDIEEILNWYSREKNFLYGVYRERQLGKLTFLKASTESKFTYHEVKCKK